MKAFPISKSEFALRAGLSGLLVGAAHPFPWIGLRYLTSQIVLWVSWHLGMEGERTAFDTVEVQGHVIQFVVACTFVELMLGIQPLLWRQDRAVSRNFMGIVLSMGALFAGNIVRIETAQILYGLGLPWVLAHDIPLGAIYFGLWVAVWQTWKRRAQCRPPCQLAAA